MRCHSAGQRGRPLNSLNAYGNVLWSQGDVLWAVPDDAPILDGVTRRLLLDSPDRLEQQP
jgi:hypothetical protein